MRKLVAAIAVAAALLVPASAFGAPGNDDFDSATVVTSLPFTVTEDVSTATRSWDDPYTSSWPNVWFRYTPTADTSLEIDTTGSNTDTYACLYTGTRGALGQVACGSYDGFYTHFFADLKAGVTYYLMVDITSGCCGQSLTLSLRDRTVANDDFANAEPISALPYQDFRDVARSTRASDDPWCTQSSTSSVWYSYTPARDVVVDARTFGSEYWTQLCAYTGTRGDLTLVGANDGVANTLFAQLELALDAGTTYWFMVAGQVDTDELTFAVSEVGAAPVVANDELDGASPLAGSVAVTQDVSQATSAVDDPSCWGRRGSVWYTITPLISGTATLSTAASDYDARLSVWTGSRGALVPYRGGDTSDCWTVGDHELSFQVEAGVQYVVEVNAAKGEIPSTLRLTGSIPAPPLAVGVTLAPRGAVDRTTGVATIGGVVTCNRSADLTVDVTVRQLKAGGSSSVNVSCMAGTYVPFTAAVAPAASKSGTIPFENGDAEVTANASGCDALSCGAASAAATVRLVPRQ